MEYLIRWISRGALFTPNGILHRNIGDEDLMDSRKAKNYVQTGCVEIISENPNEDIPKIVFEPE